MKIISLLRKTLCGACVIYTFISFMMIMLANLLGGAGANYVPNISFSAYILLFGFICSLLHSVKGEIKISGAIGNVLAFVLSYIAFYLCFFVFPGNSAEFSAIAIFSTAFIIAYAVVALVASAFARATVKKEEYTPLFEESKE